MKIPYNKKLVAVQTMTLTEGRHIGTVIQIVGLGDQPAFTAGEAPVPSIGVVVQLADTQLSKKMRISTSAFSALFGYLEASLPDPDSYEGDNPLPLTLGRPVALEVTVKGQYANIASFHRPEDFELSSVPTVAASNMMIVDDPEALRGDDGKRLFLMLHRDIRSWISKRVRSGT
jgi:hypothetical protein